MPVQAFTQQPSNDASENETRGPARVQNIQEVGAIVWEQRRYQRISYRFQCAVRQSKNKGAPIKQAVRQCRVLRRRRGQRDESRKSVENKSRNHQLAIPDLIA